MRRLTGWFSSRRALGLALPLALSMTFLAPSVGASDPVRLKYLARFEKSADIDHLMGVETILGHYALVSSNLNLKLIDLNALPPDGTPEFISQLPEGVNAYNTVTDAVGRFAYVNVHQGGFEVVSVNPDDLSLSRVGGVEESGVFFEKMFLSGNRLYVAAHSSGIRIYDITNPAAPVRVGALTTGFDDAFAIAVEGRTAYVADGAGGLKIVDLSNESNPVIVAGENPTTAAATAEDVMVIGDYVYVACGGAGIAVYRRNEIRRLSLLDTPIAAKQLAKIGPHLAVADVGGVEVLSIGPDGRLTRLAGETGARRNSGTGNLARDVTFRTWHGVTAWGDDRLVTADWDTVDVYQLVDPRSDRQPDVTASSQRLHFSPRGGSQTVQIRNDGTGALEISDIHVEPMFSVSPTSGDLRPGESMDLTIDYAGGRPGTGLVLIESNDPDENPLPIQVFGDTRFLDPGEPALAFELESWTFDQNTEEFSRDRFDLDAHRGRFVFLHIFGTW